VVRIVRSLISRNKVTDMSPEFSIKCTGVAWFEQRSCMLSQYSSSYRRTSPYDAQI